MFEAIAGKIAGSALAAGAAPLTRNLIPGQGVAITSSPFFSKFTFKQPTEVEKSDVERLAKYVLRKIKELTEREFAGLPGNEKEAAVDLLGAVFENSSSTLWECDLDPQIFALNVIRSSQARVNSSGLSTQAISFFEFLTHQVSLQIVQFITTWPSFTARAEIEQLKRLRHLVAIAERINEKLGPDLLSSDLDFEQRYCQLVSETLDQLELFGVDLKERNNRTYSLTTAYITLSVSSSGAPVNTSIQERASHRVSESLEVDEDAAELGGGAPSNAGMRAEGAIGRFKRLLLRGDAGSGKTTLLHWLSVNCSRRSLPGELSEWNTLIPFLLPLRRFAESPLPTPNNFFPEVGTHLADEMPEKWVSRMLSSGRALVLIDGVDELPSEQRESVRSWLRQLVKSYPESYYLLTSRPAAAEADWLAQDGFAVLDMLPMTQSDVTNFIEHWHNAARVNVADASEISVLERGQADLVRSIRESRQLRRLASNPLLCALLCTLNRDRNSQLPKDRMELYRAALDMLLLRRDRERRINYPEPPQLGDAQKKSILGDFAYWLMRNGLTDASEQQTINQMSLSLQSMVTVDSPAEMVYDYLLVRSGCLRRPVENRVDFVHRTFQEYLAAARIVEVDDLQSLLDHAHLDQWHEVVVMAVGHARPRERSEILSGLLNRGDEEPEFKSRLHLLAAACLETVGECDPAVFDRVRESTAKLIPPRRMTEAKDIAAAGEMVIPLIPSGRLPATVAAATVRMASLVGGDGALSLISRFAKDDRVTVQREIERAWSYFDAAEYARGVLQKNPYHWADFTVQLPHYLPALRYLTKLRNVLVLCESGNWDWVPESDVLERLQVQRNSKPIDFDVLRRTPNLRMLSFRVLGLQKFDGLRQLKHLGSLSLRGVIGEVEIPQIRSLRALTVMGVRGALNLDSLYDSVPRLRSTVLGVELSNCGSLSKFKALEAVNISRPNEELIDILANMPNLSRVSLSIPMSQVSQVPKLANITSLKRLSLEIVDVDDGGDSAELDVERFAAHPDLQMRIHTPPGTLTVVGDNEKSVRIIEGRTMRRISFIVEHRN